MERRLIFGLGSTHEIYQLACFLTEGQRINLFELVSAHNQFLAFNLRLQDFN